MWDGWTLGRGRQCRSLLTLYQGWLGPPCCEANRESYPLPLGTLLLAATWGWVDVRNNGYREIFSITVKIRVLPESMMKSSRRDSPRA